MATVISRTYHFESAHFLPMVPEGHKCRRVHGHNYKVEVVVENEDDDAVDRNGGFVIDFWDLDKFVAPLVERIDHRLLNDIDGLKNPTAELIARWFWRKLYGQFATPMLFAITVWETDECSATYQGRERDWRNAGE